MIIVIVKCVLLMCGIVALLGKWVCHVIGNFNFVIQASVHIYLILSSFYYFCNFNLYNISKLLLD